MKNDPAKLSVMEILDEVEGLAQDTKAIFGGLNSTQINWKPAADVWSIGQCLDHLITANQEYFPQLDQIIIIAAHERRHFNQAQRLIEMPGFP